MSYTTKNCRSSKVIVESNLEFLEYKKVELINISKVPEFDHDVLLVSSQKLMRAHVHSVVLDENSEESIAHVSTLIDVLGAFEEKVI